VVQSIDLTAWDFFSEIVGEDTDGMLSSFSTMTQDGTAYFKFTVSRGGEDEHVTANNIKIDVRFTEFPWDSDDTNIALLSEVTTRKTLEVEYDEEDSGDGSEEEKSRKTTDIIINFDDANAVGLVPFGEFSWATTADVIVRNATNVNETAAIEVIATSSTNNSSETEQLIAFSFVGDAAKSVAYLYWDPQAGVGYTSTTSESSTTSGSTNPEAGVGLTSEFSGSTNLRTQFTMVSVVGGIFGIMAASL
jgi:hypothetical protein